MSLVGLAVCTMVAASPFHSFTDPMREVNRCRKADELEVVLRALSKSNDETSHRALLWGSILFEGFRNPKSRFPSEILAAGKSAAKIDGYSVPTVSMQVWWTATIGRKYIPPDFRKLRIARYGTVNENGKKVKVPIWVSDEDEAAAELLERRRMTVIRSSSNAHERLVYLWWQKDTSKFVSSRQILEVAEDMDSSFRPLAVGELALREHRSGQVSSWTSAWKRIKAKDKSLIVAAAISREMEAVNQR